MYEIVRHGGLRNAHIQARHSKLCASSVTGKHLAIAISAGASVGSTEGPQLAAIGNVTFMQQAMTKCGRTEMFVSFSVSDSKRLGYVPTRERELPGRKSDGGGEIFGGDLVQRRSPEKREEGR